MQASVKSAFLTEYFTCIGCITDIKFDNLKMTRRKECLELACVIEIKAEVTYVLKRKTTQFHVLVVAMAAVYYIRGLRANFNLT